MTLKSTNIISDLSRKISKVADLISEYGSSITMYSAEGNTELEADCENMIISELSNLQNLVIKLTGVVAEDNETEVNSDENDTEGSVFAPGDLDSKSKTFEDGRRRI